MCVCVLCACAWQRGELGERRGEGRAEERRGKEG